MTIDYQWQGDIKSAEVNALHAEAFETRVIPEKEWDWRMLLTHHSLGWVTARLDEGLVGFVNVVWDGHVHAWIQDTMVAADHRALGIGTQLIQIAREQAAEAGCEWLHVDFDDRLKGFYIDACGFTPTSAGLVHL